MTYLPDLAPCTYFDDSFPGISTRLTAVGWLEPWEPAAGGPTEEAVVRALKRLARRPWTPFHFRGVHACGYCVEDRDGFGRPQRGENTDYPHDQLNLWIPAPGGRRPTIYVAPRLIVHYIECHAYQPPAAFCVAISALGRLSYFDQLEAGLGPYYGDIRAFQEVGSLSVLRADSAMPLPPDHALQQSGAKPGGRLGCARASGMKSPDSSSRHPPLPLQLDTGVRWPLRA